MKSTLMRIQGGSGICPGMGRGFTIGFGLTLMMLAAVAGAAEGGAAAAGAAAKVEDRVSSGQTAISYDDFYRGAYTEQYRQRTEMLEKESLEESLRNLGRVRMYYERLYSFSTPLSGFRGSERAAIPRIMSNRRFGKVQRELRQMPTAEAAALVNRELPLALEAYRNDLRQRVERLENQPGSFGGIAHRIGSAEDPDDDYEGPLGRQLKVLSLLLLAGEIGGADCAASVTETVVEAIAVRDQVRENEALPAATRQDLIQTTGLVSPRIIATALLRTQHSGATTGELADEFGVAWKTMHASAPTTSSFEIVEQISETKFAEVLKECLPEVEYRFELPEGDPWR